MKAINSSSALEDLSRVRLSKSIFMRDFLYSEIANFYGIPNIPADPDLAIAAGERLCQDLLEPLKQHSGMSPSARLVVSAPTGDEASCHAASVEHFHAIDSGIAVRQMDVPIRNVSSTASEGFEDARRMGSDILSVRHARKLGPEGVIARIPAGARVYVTLAIDRFCPSIAPGTGTPSHGRVLYCEVLEMLKQLTMRHEVVGIDLVEVAPDTTRPDRLATWRRRYC